jgi:hypothetical protein
MKTVKNILIGTLLFCGVSVYAQDLTKRDSIRLVKEVNTEVEIFRRKLAKELAENSMYANNDIEIAYRVDTFKIEKFLQKRRDIDYTTWDMVDAINNAFFEYSTLTGKYYQMLLKKLSETDKEVLQTAQINFMKYVEAEMKVAALLYFEEKYGGGGTEQRIDYAYKGLEFAKQRLQELYQYLSNIYSE